MRESLSAEQKKERIAAHFKEILLILGLDLNEDSLAATPARIAKMYVDEIFSGTEEKNFPKLVFEEEDIPDELILVKNISFVSFCEHHFVPMVGKAHVAYYPKKKVLGLSKIPRIVHYYARRPQLQERLTMQIASCLASELETEDIAVCLQAIHFCVVARGVKDMSAEMETHILKGRFEKNPTLRAEFFSRLSLKDIAPSVISPT